MSASSEAERMSILLEINQNPDWDEMEKLDLMIAFSENSRLLMEEVLFARLFCNASILQVAVRILYLDKLANYISGVTETIPKVYKIIADLAPMVRSAITIQSSLRIHKMMLSLISIKK